MSGGEETGLSSQVRPSAWCQVRFGPDRRCSIRRARPFLPSSHSGLESGKSRRTEEEGSLVGSPSTPFIHRKAESKMKGAGKINQYRLTFCPAGLGIEGVVGRHQRAAKGPTTR